MTEEQKNKISQLGFEISEEGRNKEYFISMRDSVPSAETLMQLFEILTIEEYLSFWNMYHPDAKKGSMIDVDGSYVSAYMTSPDVVWMEGNDGWSSYFKYMTYKELAELIRTNWEIIPYTTNEFYRTIEIEFNKHYDEYSLHKEADKSLIKCPPIYTSDDVLGKMLFDRTEFDQFLRDNKLSENDVNKVYMTRKGWKSNL